MIETISEYELMHGIRVPVSKCTPFEREPEPGPIQRYYNNLLRQVRELQHNPDATEYRQLKSLIDGFDSLRRAFDRSAPERADLNGFCAITARSAASSVGIRASTDSRTVTFIASDFSLDRHGSRIRSGGIDTTDFAKNPVLAFGHAVYGSYFSTPDPAAVIGKIKSWKVDGQRVGTVDNQRFIVAAQFDSDPESDAVFRKVQSGSLNAMSIGFLPKLISVQLENDREVPIIEECSLLECSIVPIPSNPNALAVR